MRSTKAATSSAPRTCTSACAARSRTTRRRPRLRRSRCVTRSSACRSETASPTERSGRIAAPREVRINMAQDDVPDPKKQLDRARSAYEAECSRQISTDPVERQEGLRRYREARAEYFRLLGEQRS